VSELGHEPISWLTLERYALDELAPQERTRVELRLAQSSADRACLASILNDRSELPPLHRVPSSPVISLEAARTRRRSWALLSGVVSAAAALALALLAPQGVPANRRLVSDGTKGGEVALVLHGEWQGERPSHFGDGERFKLRVTCPSWLAKDLHVVVFQGGQRYQPLPEVEDFACGNGVPWPGALVLDGAAPAEVCVTWDPQPGRRAAATSGDALEPLVVCERLEPR
jgi:hypothetical protein